MSDEQKIEVRCMARADGVIQIETQWPGLNEAHREMMNTREQMTRDALVSLGWTPPVDSEVIVDRLCQRSDRAELFSSDLIGGQISTYRMHRIVSAVIEAAKERNDG